MKVSKAKELGLMPQDKVVEPSVPNHRVLIDHFFGNTPEGVSYERAVIQYALEKHISITSDCNIVRQMMERFCPPTCPVHGYRMILNYGAGSTNHSHLDYRCSDPKCKVSIVLDLPDDAVSIRFKDDPSADE